MEEIKAGIQNIKEILVKDENFYQIPDYQRPYSWDKENVSALIDDLVTAHANNQEENYFCGSLVFVNNSEDLRFDVIDGQQRLTTFTIIACVFRDIYRSDLGQKSKDYIDASIQDKYDDSKRRLRFLTDEQYQLAFEKTVLEGIKFDDVKKLKSDNKYLENAHHIKDFLKEKIEETKISIDEFAQWFFEKVVLTVIACPNQDSAIRIFNVLNDRGMPLSPIDILKSSLMQKLGKEDRAIFKTTWRGIDSELKSADVDLDGMLTAYLHYKISANPKKRLDKELIDVFFKEKKKPLDVLNEIRNFSKAYIETLGEQDKHLYCLQYLQHGIYWTSILSTAKFTGYCNIVELKSLLVAYYYQNWIAGATAARIKQTSFNILQSVKNAKAIDTIKSAMRDHLDQYSTTQTFKQAVGGRWVYDRKWSRAILLLIEYFSSDESKPNFIEVDKKLHLEHVLPQTPTDYWKKIFSQDELDNWTDSLANLTLLSMKKNFQASNSSFEEKKKVYENKDEVSSSFLITQDIIKYKNWDVSKLEERKKRLVCAAMKRLDLF